MGTPTIFITDPVGAQCLCLHNVCSIGKRQAVVTYFRMKVYFKTAPEDGPILNNDFLHLFPGGELYTSDG